MMNDNTNDNDHLIECGVCFTPYGVDNENKLKWPVQSSKCSHVLCFECVAQSALTSFGNASAENNWNWSTLITCPMCQEPEAFNAEDPLWSRLTVQFIQALNPGTAQASSSNTTDEEKQRMLRRYSDLTIHIHAISVAQNSGFVSPRSSSTGNDSDEYEEPPRTHFHHECQQFLGAIRFSREACPDCQCWVCRKPASECILWDDLHSKAHCRGVARSSEAEVAFWNFQRAMATEVQEQMLLTASSTSNESNHTNAKDPLGLQFMGCLRSRDVYKFCRTVRSYLGICDDVVLEIYHHMLEINVGPSPDGRYFTLFPTEDGRDEIYRALDEEAYGEEEEEHYEYDYHATTFWEVLADHTPLARVRVQDLLSAVQTLPSPNVIIKEERESTGRVWFDLNQMSLFLNHKSLVVIVLSEGKTVHRHSIDLVRPLDDVLPLMFPWHEQNQNGGGPPCVTFSLPSAAVQRLENCLKYMDDVCNLCRLQIVETRSNVSDNGLGKKRQRMSGKESERNPITQNGEFILETQGAGEVGCRMRFRVNHIQTGADLRPMYFVNPAYFLRVLQNCLKLESCVGKNPEAEFTLYDSNAGTFLRVRLSDSKYCNDQQTYCDFHVPLGILERNSLAVRWTCAEQTEQT